MTIKEQNQKRRKERQKQTAEVFTPESLVKDMLDKLSEYGPEVWERSKTFCDPACGNGNFLIEILLRKIAKGHKPLMALSTVYGIDIMRDNIQECCMKLLRVLHKEKKKITKSHIRIVLRNIKWINIENHPTGSLEYGFSFSDNPRQETIDRWVEWTKNGFDPEADLPIEEEQFGQQQLYDKDGN